MNGIDIKRVMASLEEIYQCGKMENGEHSRLAFSPEDLKGRETFSAYFRALGIEPAIDSAGNLIARMEGTEPALPSIVIGSHLDTVPNGGKYDGAVGCVGGLEVCRALTDMKVTPRHPIEVVVFTDEEGARFGSGLLGSGAFCGEAHGFQADDLDVFGNRREDVFQAYGIHTASLNEAARPRDTVHCCLELHVEQGISLFREGTPIGVVSSIAGVSRYEVTVEGEANHAGSTLMGDRKDALVAAASFVAAVPEIVARWGNQFTVATVGSIQAEPGSVNVVPGKCVFSLEIRDQEEKMISLIWEKLRERLEETASRFGCGLQVRRVSDHAPAPMSEFVREAIHGACEKLGYPNRAMPSGAFHDSLILTAKFPTGMIFIPSEGGISHSPREFTREADIEKGCNVLLETVLRLDRQG